MGAVGIFGGSFDPVHNAHIKLAEHAYKELGLSKVIFIPAYLQPFKVDKEVTNEVHRINMLKLATKEYPYFEVSDIEVKMGGKSYTARTLTELKREYDELVFILGADSYMSLYRWYMPEVIFKQATIACAVRDEVDMDDLVNKSKEYSNEFQGNTVFLKMPRTDISSTDLRESLIKGEKPLDLISEDVYEYIKENGLYV